jgi:hypothetical protein
MDVCETEEIFQRRAIEPFGLSRARIVSPEF